MALSRVHKTILGGDPLAPLDAAVCSVKISRTDNLQAIYADRDGAILLPNPFTTSANGLFSFYVEPGLYDFDVTHPSGNQTYTDYYAVDDRVNSLVFTPPSDGAGFLWESMPPQGLNSGSQTAGIRSISSNGDVLVSVHENGFAARSTDNGVTWVALPQNLGVVDATNWRSVSNDGAGVWVAVSATGHASRSADNGATWAEITPRGLNSGDTNAGWESIHTDGAGVWVAVSSGGWASRSTDNGVTWAALTQGLNTGLATAWIRSVRTDGSGIWVAVCNSGYAARSSDNGATWTALVKGLNSGDANQSFGAVDTDSSGTWIAGGSPENSSISTDAGETWSQITGGILTGDQGDIRSLATNGNGLWVASAFSGYSSISVNNGLSWSILTRGLGAASISQNSETLEYSSSGSFFAGFAFGYASASRPA